jgi:hypothetical protein
MPHGNLYRENFVFDLITIFHELYYVRFMVKVWSETSSVLKCTSIVWAPTFEIVVIIEIQKIQENV